ncbi:tyrosine-type recombinase/integrase [Pseudooceanicola atlanticus]|uniref:tyrosine-type recombinase/integrase n=1 Tax=Pseudooceanicola atlanticus TaxID=1461694 RepID=UPI000693A581|nr:tyrosine-type recombinase/integrase [Pseudooceanicola atlanticus]
MPLKLDKVKGSDNWYAIGTVAGQRIRKSLGTRDRQRAEELRAQIEARAWNASVYGEASVAVFEDAALSYLEDGHDGRFVAPLLQHFRGRPLREITGKEIRDAAKAIYPKASNATRNRQAITPARAIINHAADQGLCSAIRVKQFPVDKSPRQAATLDWLTAFRSIASERNPRLAALAWFMFETGARLGEAVALSPERIDHINCRADLGRTKNGERYHADFSAELRTELIRLAARNGKVFGYKSRHSVYGPWQTTCRLAEIPYIPPHQAGRHSLATLLNDMGWTANDIAEAGRWKSVRLVQETYVHPDGKGKAAAGLIGKKMTKPTGQTGQKRKEIKRKGDKG